MKLLKFVDIATIKTVEYAYIATFSGRFGKLKILYINI